MIEIVYRFDPDEPRPARLPRDADQARSLLEEGNRDFARLAESAASGPAERHVIAVDPRDLGAGGGAGLAPVQEPFAAVLGCSDARVPTEIVFECGCNELFVVRVAGNVLGSECLGSVRYAAHHFARTLRLAVVLGHTQCGAVTEAVDCFLAPARYLPLAANYPLRSIVDRILVVVRDAAGAIERVHGAGAARRSGYRAALIETAVALNAAWTAYSLRAELGGHGGQHGGDGGLGVVFGVYDLVSRWVRLPVSRAAEVKVDELGLFPPPEDAAGFAALGERLARGEVVAGLLSGR